VRVSRNVSFLFIR